MVGIVRGAGMGVETGSVEWWGTGWQWVVIVGRVGKVVETGSVEWWGTGGVERRK